MKILLVVTFLWIASVGVLQSPDHKGTPKQNGTGGTNPSGTANQAQKKTSNALPNGIVVNCNQGCEKGPESGKNAQGESRHDNDIEIQRKIAKFTKLLVVVGFLQFLALLGTLEVVGLQAKLMGTHAKHLDNLAKAASNNAQAATLQVQAMQGQITEMSVQSGLLQQSVGVAQSSANAARDSVNLVINKERARIIFSSLTPLSLSVGVPLKVEFRLLYHGSTPAFTVTSEMWIAISDSRESFEKNSFVHGIPSLPSIIFPTANVATAFHDVLLKPIPLDQTTAQEIDTGKVFVHVKAIIRYTDFFDCPRETAFHYQWNALDNSANSLRRIFFSEGWHQVGGKNENYYT